MGEAKIKEENRTRTHRIHFEHRERAVLATHLVQATLRPDGSSKPATMDRDERRRLETLFEEIGLVEIIDSGIAVSNEELQRKDITVYTVTNGSLDELYDRLAGPANGPGVRVVMAVERRIEAIRAGKYELPEEAKHEPAAVTPIRSA